MVSVITGDIINSRKASSATWLAPLKKQFNLFGKSPATWEIYRGDSFQIEISDPTDALLAALRIKATLRSIRDMDVRMAVGVGKKTFTSSRVSESNGPAFVNSGEKFEELTQLKDRLGFRTPWPEFDRDLNLMISLASIVMDKWTTTSAEMIIHSLQHQQLSQAELGTKLKRSQSSISERQKRAHFREIMEMESWYRLRIGQKPAK